MPYELRPLPKVQVTKTRRVYVGRHRVHHGLFGVLLALIGVACAYHDRRDYPWPFIDRT